MLDGARCSGALVRFFNNSSYNVFFKWAYLILCTLTLIRMLNAANRRYRMYVHVVIKRN